MPLDPAKENSILLGPLGGIDEERDAVAISKGDFVSQRGVFGRYLGGLARIYGKYPTLKQTPPILGFHQFFGSVGTIGNIFQPGTTTVFTETPPLPYVNPYDPGVDLPTDTNGDTVTPTNGKFPTVITPPGNFPNDGPNNLRPGVPPSLGTEYPITDFVTSWDRYDGHTDESSEVIWTSYLNPPRPPVVLPVQNGYTHTTATKTSDHLRDSQAFVTISFILLAPAGISVGWGIHKIWTGSYTSAVFNFSGISKRYNIFLIGTYSLLKTDGTTESGPCWQDISAYAGTNGGTLRVYAPSGSAYTLINEGSGSITKTDNSWVDYPTVWVQPKQRDVYR